MQITLHPSLHNMSQLPLFLTQKLVSSSFPLSKFLSPPSSNSKFCPRPLTPNSKMSSLYPNSVTHSFTPASSTCSLSPNSLLSHTKLCPLFTLQPSCPLLPISNITPPPAYTKTQCPKCRASRPVSSLPSPSNLSPQCPKTLFY